MSDSLHNNKRLVKNSLTLYARMFFTMGIGLYTSRVVLHALGVVDYGIYNVIGGVVLVFSILSGSLSAAISRFITFELGRGSKEQLQKIFSSSVLIQIFLGIIIVILVEIGGIWFIRNKMTIPPELISQGIWVLQCSALTFFFNLLNVPYNALIIAHEDMKAFAYISVLESCLKLGAVFLLYAFGSYRLVYYGIFLAAIAIGIRILYMCYCRRHYEECVFTTKIDRKIFKDVTAFAGWNFIGNSSSILRDQGVNVLLNVYCGPVVNAARGIAMQVNSAVVVFISGFTTAMNPQITKTYAGGEIENSRNLAICGSKFSYFLALLMAMPIMFVAPRLLAIWLGIVPEHTIIFVRLTMAFLLVETLSYTLINLALATGDIKRYQIIVGSIYAFNFPLSWVLLYLGLPPQTPYYVAIGLSVLALVVRLKMLQRMVDLSIRSYAMRVFGKILPVSIISALPPLAIVTFMDDTILRFLLTIVVSVVSVGFFVYFIGLAKSEKELVDKQIRKRIKKVEHEHKKETTETSH